ncbi:helix-turn-helix domain-containing protein [Streptomyces sp. NPDC001678]|uniref:helix-turn-helix domain-containing protein n=1 Tax=Streptomyces sp. NPDC001678 TaxID=3364599 RepID=UPI00368DE16F
MSAPTVRRRRLGTKLRALRDGLGLTLEDVAARADGRITVAKLSRLETARTPAKPVDVKMLLALYGVDDELCAALIALANEGSARGWWHSYRGVLSPVYEDLISLEAEAASVRSWQMGAIPGLLQTAEYAREIISSTATSAAVKGKVDALVEVRLARQSILTSRERPLDLRVVIGESALHTKCREDGVMHDQLTRLLTVSRRPNITIQVLPAGVPPHVGQMGSFSLLGFADHSDLDVVHIESLTSGLYVEDGQEVAVYQGAFERLSAAALAPEVSAERIAEIRKTA